MTSLDWVAVAVIVGGLVYLRRQIVALVGGAASWVRKRPLVWGVALTLVVLIVAVWLAWKVPIWQLASRAASLEPDRYLELQNAYRATIVQALAGIALLVTIYLTWRRVAATEQQVEVAREEQITERFTRAIEQLGSEKLEVRLGGIYALERIARDSEKDHWPIMEVLTAYVRENAAWDEEEQDPEPIRTDIQAILTVIGRRQVQFDRAGERILDVSGTNLSIARLAGAEQSRANLYYASLYLANLVEANLSSAFLVDANLTEANLTGANLAGANLIGADLSSAHLAGANLSWANLSEAKGLTREQIESAITDEKTKLPEYLKEVEEESAEDAASGEGES
ncbi:MAG: pentapeptide repeat-containing protein [Armatimonadetes bacterium]|nr:pentapeptide repeat-containing protein [Armatimonadota bacterium]